MVPLRSDSVCPLVDMDHFGSLFLILISDNDSDIDSDSGGRPPYARSRRGGGE